MNFSFYHNFDENEFLLYNYNYLFLFNNVILEYD